MDQQALIAANFRGAELANRARRRKYLLDQVEAVLQLEYEEMDEVAVQAHLNAITKLRAIERSKLRDVEAGYWEKLWLAIRGKLS